MLDSYSYSAPGVETQARKNPYYGYILDEFKIRPNLTLNAGLRYEYYGVDYDKNNIGLVFDPFTCGLQYCPPGTSFYFPEHARLRAARQHRLGARRRCTGRPRSAPGGGIFYSDGQFGGLYAAQTNIGQNFSLTQKNIPGLTYPFTPFLGAAAFSISYSGKDRHRKDIAVDEWNFSIQQEIARDTMLQVGYLGTKGTHLFRKGLVAERNRSGHRKASVRQPDQLHHRLDHGRRQQQPAGTSGEPAAQSAHRASDFRELSVVARHQRRLQRRR